LLISGRVRKHGLGASIFDETFGAFAKIFCDDVDDPLACVGNS